MKIKKRQPSKKLSEKPNIKNNDIKLKQEKHLKKIITALIFNLNKERATEYNKWIKNILFILKILFNNNNDGRQLFDKFSQQDADRKYIDKALLTLLKLSKK